MKFPSLSTAAIFALAGSLSAESPKPLALQPGDIVFSSATRGGGEAIVAATGSPYAHCGIVFSQNGKLMVLEAVQPVGVIVLEKFIARSDPKAFAVRRPKVQPTPEAFAKARAWGAAQVGKDYDPGFQWSDDKMYCSELVWKIYKEAGIELCPPRRFRDYDLAKPSVKKMIDERFGGMAKLPLDEKVVAPSDLADSPLLEAVPTAP